MTTVIKMPARADALRGQIESKIADASALLNESVPEILDELNKASASASDEKTPQKVTVAMKLDFEATADGRFIVNGGVQTTRSIKRSFDLEGETLDPRQVPLDLAPKA